MGLLDIINAVVSATGNAGNQPQGEQPDLGAILSHLTGGTTVSGDAAHNVVGAVGSVLKPLLQQASASGGMESVNQILGALQKGGAAPDELHPAVGTEHVDMMLDQAQQKSGLPMDAIKKMLPTVLPMVASMLQGGGHPAPVAASGEQAEQAAPAQGVSALAGLADNPLVKQFLDTDGDGHVDMMDMMRMGMKFLSKK